MSTETILTEWNGEAFVPLQRHHNVCASTYVIGERYFIEPIEPRNMAMHRAYFAQLRDVWMNMPEEQADRFGSAEALRKHCLIMTGYRNERTFVCNSKAEAQRFAAFIRPIDVTAVITVRETVVREWTAQSQKRKAMGPTRFKASIDDVIEYAAGMIGVDPASLRKKAETSA